jgi:cysteine dioxygenase
MMDFVDKNDCGASESKWDGDLTRKGLPITDTNTLLQSLDNVFALGGEWPEKKSKLQRILQLVDLSTTEVNKYTFFDVEKPYTRNLIGTDNINYTLLLLCWNPGRESKIHNHPCDGCFIKTLAGCIKETRYEVTTSTSSIHRTATRFYCEGVSYQPISCRSEYATIYLLGQVSFMDDYIGLHKIGNPSNSTGAITLHLYTPPFSVCKVILHSSTYS